MQPQKKTITYGSIVSISSLEDETAFITGDGLTNNNLYLKGRYNDLMTS